MASAPNVDGMVDIRSYAIFQDVSYNQDECAPGVEIAGVRAHSQMKTTLNQPLYLL